ncbi:cupin domain-containing protein [Mucilaginibacter sp.]|uniref:(R)-mandelonitrile lyase n=1 Tax=Mucilaginibacter sp. TaxID=1882438 RepID=UPI0025D312DD|nr:cupin domain-containing protein [Mucilaginibacter sp.]
MENTENQAPIFPKGDAAPADYFTGTTWVNTLVPKDTTLNTVVASVIFERGSRNNWHTHPGGQILLVTDGTGYYQEKGKPIQVIRKGDVITIAPDLLHWHGASANSEMTHIAVNPNTQTGMVNWLERVTDEEYNGLNNI